MSWVKRYRAWILGSALLYTFAAAAENPPKPPATAPAQHAASAPDSVPELPNLNFTLPPLTHYQEIIERPVFMPDRKPQQPEEQPQAADAGPTNPLQARLLGTIITPERRQALIEDVINAKVLRLEQGQPIQDWQVKEIKPDRVVLVRQGQPQELLLRVYNEGQPGAPGGAQVTAQARLPGTAQPTPVPQPMPPQMSRQMNPVQQGLMQRRYQRRMQTR